MARASENYREYLAGRANVEDPPELDAYHNARALPRRRFRRERRPSAGEL